MVAKICGFKQMYLERHHIEIPDTYFNVISKHGQTQQDSFRGGRSRIHGKPTYLILGVDFCTILFPRSLKGKF